MCETKLESKNKNAFYLIFFSLNNAIIRKMVAIIPKFV